MSAPTHPPRSRLIPLLYCATAFLGASLIFAVQPLVSKLLLPSYGGSAAVWTTASFFFQVVLLLGYMLVHGSTRLRNTRQPYLFLPFALLALLFLPLALPHLDTLPSNPAAMLIVTLLAMIALPFLVLSTTGPLLQKWYSWTDAPRAEDPYFLYAASNVGSFVGLFSYPFLVEPNLTLGTQRLTWSAGFVLFLLLMSACAFVMLKHRTVAAPQAIQATAAPLSWPEQLKWIGLAFLPSSLMLGVTTYIATDVASIPLLWVVPLGIYIASMIWAFGRKSRHTHESFIYVSSFVACLALTLTFVPHALSPKNTALFLFLTLALVACAAHFLLANTRPSPQHLTRYFVLVSLGGALGGLFNSLIAPLIFVRTFELPIVLALVPLLMLTYPIRRWVIAATVVLLLCSIGIRDLQTNPATVARSRTFYGSYTVEKVGTTTQFIHGTTVHGIQSSDPEWAGEPLSYYARGGPLGYLFEDRRFEQSTLVGLGIGSLTPYGEAGTRQHFVEIDPEVVRIAEDTRYFTYLRDAKADVSIEVNDGRLAIEALEDQSQDLILLDAFSSDSIPVHLLTEDALAAYETKLNQDGMMAIHISNRVFDLVPVVVGAAQRLDRRPLYMSKEGDEVGPLGKGSTWMVLPANDEQAESLIEDGWKDLSYVKPVHWTDDYSSVLDVMY